MSNELIAQTYIEHDGKWYLVSTINRESSAAAAYGSRYAETMVWEWDWKTSARGAIVAQDEASEGSIRAHQRMVETIRAHGVPQ